MSDSDDDWFNKDEEELVENLREHVKQQLNNETHEERIDDFVADEYERQLRLEPNHDVATPDRFTMVEFDKALKMTPLEMFLFFMSEQRDIFTDQIAPNHSHKRVLQYVQILTSLCKLQLGGFDDQFLSGFAKQTTLLEHIRVFALKVFTQSSKGNMDAESEKMLRNVKFLLTRAHKVGALQESGYDLIEHFKKLVANCQIPQLLKHPLTVEFQRELQILPSVVHAKNEIYPKLDHLLGNDPATNVEHPDNSADVTAYISWQRRLLFEDFMLPLREYVQRIHSQENIEALEAQCLLWPHTQLLLNPDFAETDRNNLIFVDLKPAERKVKDKAFQLKKAELNYTMNIKGGALLCFTTSYEFDNLVLATVSYTNPNDLRKGFISVEIVKQYNFGNTYGVPLIMFETPVFFEPYLRVHTYLSTCSADDFPMQDYIVKGQLDVRRPAYISEELPLLHDGKRFTVANPPENSKLNHSQQSALVDALSKEFCLIQGPPGTGKTHLSVELVKMLIQNADTLKSGPIILLTFTNDSLDKFLLKAAQHTDSILRFGSQTRLPQIVKYNVRLMSDDQSIPPRLKRVWWMTKCEYKEMFQRLQALQADFDGSEPAYLQIQETLEKLQFVAEKINTLRTIFQFYQARDKALLAMTTTCAARLNFLFRLLQSKCFIFEEAGEISEPHILACLTPYTEHVILIGDHKQLKPHTGNHTMQALQVSLFERLITNKFPANILNMQYRMHSSIADLLVPIFYDNLISDDSVKAYKSLASISTNLYFVDHQEPEKQLMDSSFVNKHEAEELVKLAISLKEKPNHIVMLTPYNGQVECIKALLQIKRIKGILVTTVDSYQGLEANIVLLSLVRSNTAGQIGFLRLPNRVCVALSRARWALYIMGNVTTLKRGNPDLWGAIFAKLQDKNAIGAAFPLARDKSA